MGIERLAELLKGQIAGVLVVGIGTLIFGTLPKICSAEGLPVICTPAGENFNHPKFAEPFRESLREKRYAPSAGKPN